MPPEARFPRRLIWGVLLCCALPPFLNLLGVDFSSRGTPLDLQQYFLTPAPERSALLYEALRGAFTHTVLEWTAFCVALVTVTLSFQHYFLSRDIVAPIVGTALFFSGMLDAFHVLAADRLIEQVVHQSEFIPFTWTISRTVNALILVAGTAPFLWGEQAPIVAHRVRYILLVGVLCGLVSYGVIHLCAAAPRLPLPHSVAPAWLHRPLDLVPLALYLLAAGIVLPRMYRRYRNLFVRGLHVSVVPHLAAQCYAVGSAALYDNAFNVASGLKVVAYLVPLAGLFVDYSRAYRAQAALRAAEEQLRLAREIQQALLPQQPPRWPRFDVAGRCQFAEAVGGDYFDYMTLPNGRGLVAIADVSGHDPGASLLMANTHAYLHALAAVDADLESLSRSLNHYLCRVTGGRRFVTMFLVELDPDSLRLRYVGAGHAGYLLRADGALETLERTGTAFGIETSLAMPCGPDVTLRTGDTLLLATDGLFETASPGNEYFDVERAAGVLRRCADQPAADRLDVLLDALRAFRGKAPPLDDVTAIILSVGDHPGPLDPPSTPV